MNKVVEGTYGKFGGRFLSYINIRFIGGGPHAIGNVCHGGCLKWPWLTVLSARLMRLGRRACQT